MITGSVLGDVLHVHGVAMDIGSLLEEGILLLLDDLSFVLIFKEFLV